MRRLRRSTHDSRRPSATRERDRRPVASAPPISSGAVTLDPRLRLFLLSFLMLFVELALIRWLGSNIVYLSYFTNFVLLGSFLGIGIGFLRATSKRDLFPWAPAALAALVGLVVIAPSTARLSTDESLYFQSPGATGLPIWLALPIVFILSATVMATIAEGVARQFAAFTPLNAYRLDILGSIAGIVAFAAISSLGWPPIAWGIVAVALYAAVTSPSVRGRVEPIVILQAVAGVILLGALAIESTAPNTSWSTYHKVELSPAQPGVTQVRINGTPSQFIQSTESMRTVSPFFFYPYESRTAPEPPKDVLIIGGGTGSDTAAALASGAEHVDVVEIDPRLVELGRTMNPDGAFLDPRVDVHVTDGREFLESNDTRYDLVVFALPDSIALVAGQSGVRLESFLFTREAMDQAKAHLTPDGVFALVNYFREPFVADRLASMTSEVFGTAPCLTILGDEGHLASLIVSADPTAFTCPTATWAPTGAVPEASTDDHPFPYVADRMIPDFYLLAIGLILLVSLGAVQLASGSVVRMRPYIDLFFMGAGFLLLETRNIVTFSLLFGTTWLVNALVFAGILVAVLAAIEVADRFRPRRPELWYVALLASLAVAWPVPASWLLSLPWAVRLAVAIVVAFLPVFIANVIFAQRFRDVASSTTAFGANLLGAMLGGVLEYAAIVTGYTSLLVVAAILYGLAFLFGRSKLARPPPLAVPTLQPTNRDDRG
jgi:hypothetical protein